MTEMNETIIGFANARWEITTLKLLLKNEITTILDNLDQFFLLLEVFNQY